MKKLVLRRHLLTTLYIFCLKLFNSKSKFVPYILMEWVNIKNNLFGMCPDSQTLIQVKSVFKYIQLTNLYFLFNIFLSIIRRFLSKRFLATVCWIVKLRKFTIPTGIVSVIVHYTIKGSKYNWLHWNLILKLFQDDLPPPPPQ